MARLASDGRAVRRLRLPQRQPQRVLHSRGCSNRFLSRSATSTACRLYAAPSQASAVLCSCLAFPVIKLSFFWKHALPVLVGRATTMGTRTI